MRVLILIVMLVLLPLSTTQAEAPATTAASLAIRDAIGSGNEDRIDDAIDTAEEQAEAQPDSAEAHYWLGAAHGSMATRVNMLSAAGHARKLKAAFERAIELDPKHVEAVLGLMQFYLQAPGFMGGDPEAATELAEGLDAVSKVAGHRGRAIVKRVGKDEAGAIAELKSALAIEPANPDVVAALVSIYSAKQNWNDYKAVVDAALAAAPDDARTRYHVGRHAAMSGTNLDAGLAELDALAAQKPAPKLISEAGLHWRRGQILQKLGRADEALVAVRRAASIEPDSKDIQKTLDELTKAPTRKS